LLLFTYSSVSSGALSFCSILYIPTTVILHLDWHWCMDGYPMLMMHWEKERIRYEIMNYIAGQLWVMQHLLFMISGTEIWYQYMYYTNGFSVPDNLPARYRHTDGIKSLMWWAPPFTKFRCSVTQWQLLDRHMSYSSFLPYATIVWVTEKDYFYESTSPLPCGYSYTMSTITVP